MRHTTRDTFSMRLARRLPRRTALLQLAAGAGAGALAAAGSRWVTGHAIAQSASPPAGSSAFMVLRRYQLLAGESMDELVRIVNEGFVPIISKIPGFKEYLLVDAGNGAHITISLFDSLTGAEASTEAAAGWAAENVAQRLEGPAEVTEGWVRIQVSANEVAETV